MLNSIFGSFKSSRSANFCLSSLSAQFQLLEFSLSHLPPLNSPIILYGQMDPEIRVVLLIIVTCYMHLVVCVTLNYQGGDDINAEDAKHHHHPHHKQQTTLQ